RTHRDRILVDWLHQVRRLRPAQDLERPMLLDGLPQFLDDLAASAAPGPARASRSEEHTSELQSLTNLVCRLLLEKKKKNTSRDGPCYGTQEGFVSQQPAPEIQIPLLLTARGTTAHIDERSDHHITRHPTLASHHR